MRGARKFLPQVLKVAGRRPSAGQHENDQTRRARRVCVCARPTALRPVEAGAANLWKRANPHTL